MKLLLQNHRTQFDLPIANANSLKWSVWNDKIDVNENELVAFNTFSQNAVLMDVSEMKDPAVLDEPLRNTLFQLGILVASDKDERAEWETHFF